MEYVEVKQLAPSELNPRNIKPKDFQKLKKSIESHPQYFEDRPCLVNRRTWEENKLVIYAGNMRYRAALELGLEKVPCIIRELTKDLEKKLTVLDNIRSGRWDDDILANLYEVPELEDIGFNFDEIGSLKIFGEEARTTEDPVPSVPNTPRAKEGFLYTLGSHKVICGDSTNAETVKALFIDDRADMIFTDPPYNRDYEGYTEEKLKMQSDKMTPDQYLGFLTAVYRNYFDTIKKGASAYVCHPNWYSREHQNTLESVGFEIRSTIIWVKNVFAWGFSRYKWQHEPIFYAHVKGSSDAWYGDKSQSTIWNVDKPSKNKEHPSMKPLKLIGMALTNSSKAGDIVADFFLGSGSTLIACEQMGRKCFGLEIDPKYCDVVIERYCALAKKDKEEVYAAAVQVIS